MKMTMSLQEIKKKVDEELCKMEGNLPSDANINDLIDIIGKLYKKNVIDISEIDTYATRVANIIRYY